MEKFKIEIQETLSRIVEVEAENVDEAILKTNEMYKDEKIVLSENDFVATKIDKLEE